jgi:hypothetical protein
MLLTVSVIRGFVVCQAGKYIYPYMGIRNLYLFVTEEKLLCDSLHNCCVSDCGTVQNVGRVWIMNCYVPELLCQSSVSVSRFWRLRENHEAFRLSGHALRSTICVNYDPFTFRCHIEVVVLLGGVMVIVLAIGPKV